MIERKTNLFKISTYLSENPILVLALIFYILLEFYSSFKHYKKLRHLSWQSSGVFLIKSSQSWILSRLIWLES